jgi:predicted AAA+ superfamily ATPase
MIIQRALHNIIEQFLFKNKAIIIYGARQVGKTTLVKSIIEKYQETALYLNCDEPDIRLMLYNKTSTELKYLIGQKKLVVIDEAQMVKDVGITLKLMIDNFPEIQIIATGSSSFELASTISQPLTGRKLEFQLFSFSIGELRSIYSALEIDRLLPQFIIYGMYPEIVLAKEHATILLKNLAYSYSYKDVLQYQQIKNPEILEKLLQALALQIGNEVSYNELSSLIGIDKNTVANYIRILEQAFIIFRLPPLKRNLRNEIKNLKKIYFWDTGIRNALINNFNPLELRQDVGALWENFFISERLKFLHNSMKNKNTYFWRTQQKHEIDYVEEANGLFEAFEIKWNKQTVKFPSLFSQSYQVTHQHLVNRQNYSNYV